MVEATLEKQATEEPSASSSKRGHKRKSEEPCIPPRHHQLEERKSEEPCTPPRHHQLEAHAEEPKTPLLEQQEVNASSPLLTASPLPRMNPDCPYAVTHAWKDGELLEVTPLKQSAENTVFF